MVGDRNDARNSDQALRALYLEYDGAVRGFITKQFTQDTGLIDEVVQDTFVEVWKFPERYNDEYAFKTWLLGIARHKAIDALRQVSTTNEPIEKLADTLPAAAPDIIDVIHDDQVNHLLKSGLTKLVETGKLSAEHGEVLQLMYVKDLSVTEMAAIIRCPENTVKTRLYYARDRVRSYFETCLTGFIFHSSALKLTGSAKIGDVIDHAGDRHKSLDADSQPQSAVTGSDYHQALAWRLIPARIPGTAGGDCQAVPDRKPALLDSALSEHFQDLGCQAAADHNATMAALLAQNGKPAAISAVALDGAMTLTELAQALDFLVSAGGNADPDAGAAKTASGAPQAGNDGGGVKAGACMILFSGDNTGHVSLDGHVHHDGLDSQVNQNGGDTSAIVTGGTQTLPSASSGVFSGHTGDDHGHNDAYGHSHPEIVDNSPMFTHDSIHLVGLAHEPVDILSNHLII